MIDVVENLRQLHRVLLAAPETQFDLRSYHRMTKDPVTHECKTFFCAAGWAAEDPYFKAQGMGWKFYGLDRGLRHRALTFQGETHKDVTGLKELFGMFAFSHLFDFYGQGGTDFRLMTEEEYDRFGHDGTRPFSDKELALRRVEYRFKDMTGEDLTRT